MKRERFTPTAVKVVLPMVATDGSRRLNPNNTRLMDLGWAIRKGLVRIETDALLGKSNGVAPNSTKVAALPEPVYILKRMPRASSVQPQVFAILSTLKSLGGTASRERLLKALVTRLRTDQDVGTVLSLKRKGMIEDGYLRIKERAG